MARRTFPFVLSDDIRKRLSGPFVPFTIRTSDGREFRVPHREFAFVTPGGHKVVIADQRGLIDIVQVFQIVSVQEEGSLPTA